MASTQGNAFFNYVIHQLEANANPMIGRFSRHWQILMSTGPTFIWKMASNYAAKKGLTESQSSVKVDTLPAWVWGKCKICKGKCIAPPDGYLQHLQGDSWHSWDSVLFTYGFFCHVEFTICLGMLCVLLLDKHYTRKFQPFLNRDWYIFYGVILSILWIF